MLGLGPSFARAGATPEIKVIRARVEGAAAATAVLTRKANKTKASAMRCYRAALKHNKGQVARLYLDVGIKPDGSVTSVSMDRNSAAPKGLFKCVASYVKRWKLSPWRIKHKVMAGLGYDFLLWARPPKGAVIKGGLKPRYVAGLFAAYRPDLKACIRKPVEKLLKLRASVGILFDGKVSSASVSGRWNRLDKKCMSEKMQKWRFPFGHHGHRSYCRYPLTFKPSGAAKSTSPR
jgi:hypothetical protein